ncbi:dethiobiotin synthase [Thermanaerovibrio acidaminovorans]|uniref:ATP-dependent dethiobiotin synthetase BioD n=1 Tax=Thermanaerovibrio acidaminovorans (strain ATCC 49978 / DSM 6589 / Su883) TaxID=525903 RepID=D1B880_THEAS|nr:dethiobiotin synthase [Thermanaerovibrio acidaminovorans]ACZ18483.1 dethiobiotin synthase [Thermanaerovibrio acidaminovorans DSM 6589]
MSGAFWILGTGTDVGKTHLSCLILRAAGAMGRRWGYFKPVGTGVRLVDRVPMPEDGVAVSRVTGADPRDLVGLWFRFPASPHLSASLEGASIGPREEALVRDRLDLVIRSHPVTLIEGAGGAAVPLGDGLMLAHWVARWGHPAALVAPGGLGTLSCVVTGLEYLRSLGVDVRCVVLNRFDPEDPIHRDNARWIRDNCGVPVFTVAPEGSHGDLVGEWMETFMEVMGLEDE